MEFYLQLLGKFQLTRGDAVIEVVGEKHRRILANLALAGKDGIEKRELLERVWPDKTSEKSQANNLGSQLHTLRQFLPKDIILFSEGMYRLNTDMVRVDVPEFVEHIKQAMDRALPSTIRIAHFEEADALWRGRPLLNVPGDTYLDGKVRDLMTTRATSQLEHGELLLALDRTVEAIALATRLTGEPEVSEQDWMLLMKALHQAGRRQDALAVFDTAAAHLDRVLKVAPSPELTSLSNRILNEEVISGPTAERAPHNAAVQRLHEPIRCNCWVRRDQPMIVGRDVEVQALNNALDDNRIRLILLEGEPGIGKTRLIEDYVAGSAPIALLYGRCQFQAIDSYEPLANACADLVDHLELTNEFGEVDITSDHFSPSMAPALRTMLGATIDLADRRTNNPNGNDAFVDGAYRREVLESVARLLRLACSTKPRLILVIDDVHLADTDTLDAIRHLANTRTAAYITIVMTAAPQFQEDGRLTTYFNPMLRSGTARVIPIPPLGDADATSVVTQIIPDDDQISTDIVNRAGGNPHFLLEMASIARSFGRDGSSGNMLSSLTQPATQRISQLSERQRVVIEAASIMGQQFDAELLPVVADLSRAEVTHILTSLNRDRLVHSTGKRDRYVFNHKITRDAVYQNIEPLRRAELHARAAEELVNRRDAGFMVTDGDLARHITAAAQLMEPSKVVAAVRAAADEAAADWSRSRQAKELEIALDFIPAAQRSQRAEVLVELADAYGIMGRNEENKKYALEAADLARKTGDSKILARAALSLGGTIPASDFADPAAVSLIAAAIEAVGDSDDGVRARLLARQARVLYLEAPVDDRLAWCSEADMLARRSGSKLVEASVVLNTFWALEGAVSNETQWQLADRLEQIADELDHKSMAIHAQKCRVHALIAIGELLRAEEVIDQLETVAEVWDDPEATLCVLRFRAMISAANGDFATSVEQGACLKRSFEAAGRGMHGGVVAALHEAPIRWFTGTWDQIVEILRVIVLIPHAPAVWDAMHALAEVSTGDRDAALAALERAEQRWGDSDRTMSFWMTIFCGFHASLLLESEHHLDWYSQRVLSRADDTCHVGQTAFLGFPSYYLGLLARRNGDIEEAIRHQQDATDSVLRFGLWPWGAVSAVELLEMGATLPKEFDDLDHLETMTETMGMTPWLSRIQALR